MDAILPAVLDILTASWTIFDAILGIAVAGSAIAAIAFVVLYALFQWSWVHVVRPRKERKFDAEEERLFNALLALGGTINDRIILKDRDERVWRDRANYVEQMLEEFVGYSQELGTFRSDIFPLYVGLADMYGGYDGMEKYGYCILIGTHMMRVPHNELANVLAHEYAHVLSPENEHDDVWRWHYESLWLMHTHGEYTSA